MVSERVSLRLVWLLTLLSVLFAVAGSIFLPLIHDFAHFTDLPALSSDAAYLLNQFAIALLGAFIVAKRPRHPMGWLLLLAGVAGTLQEAALEYAVYDVMKAPGTLPGGIMATWVSQWLWSLPVFSLFIGLLVFPSGRLLSPRWRWVIVADVVLVCLVCFFGALVSPMLVNGDPNYSVPNPLGFISIRIQDLVQWVNPLLLAFFLTVFFSSLVAVIIRFRQSQGDERQQLKWFMYAAAFTLLSELVGGWLFDPYSGAVQNLAFLSLPVAIAIAILKYHLYDIDILIRRTLIYSALTAILALIYFGSVAVLQELLTAVSGQRSDIAIIVSTLAIAALFVPVRNRVQKVIDHRFYRRKYDAAQVLARFSATVRDEVDLNQLTSELLGVVAETMQPQQVSLWLRMTDDERRRTEKA